MIAKLLKDLPRKIETQLSILFVNFWKQILLHLFGHALKKLNQREKIIIAKSGKTIIWKKSFIFWFRYARKAFISDIPPVIFSEVMRDVDLAVSVAHAGGVDPETSHSTMEMRASILSFVLPMFRIGNVRIEGNHALVDGKLAEYSIHLGSGVVHQLGGAMIPVLPVHSQHKGKIFLPFVDDDPKTAEIISKVILFAEDHKLKDPSILEQISK